MDDIIPQMKSVMYTKYRDVSCTLQIKPVREVKSRTHKRIRSLSRSQTSACYVPTTVKLLFSLFCTDGILYIFLQNYLTPQQNEKCTHVRTSNCFVISWFALIINILMYYRYFNIQNTLDSYFIYLEYFQNIIYPVSMMFG